MKKMLSLALALIMALALCVPTFAQDVPEGVAVDATKATITISNAAKGETYSIYKLFDATVADKDNTQNGAGPINYTGTIPANLADYFVADAAGNITATAAAKNGDKMSDELQAALKDWAGTQTATASTVSDGSALSFNNLAFGYYVITTTQGNQTISVDSTNPDVTVVDKNSTTPTVLVKSSADEDNNLGFKIGDTVTYTVKFNTSNYDGAGTDARQITEYVIHDTLPAFLDNVTVTRIIVDNDGNTDTTDDQTVLPVQQFGDGEDEANKITLPWVSGTQGAYTSLYKNGAYVILTYTAVVTDEAAVDGNGNTNKVTVTWGGEGYLEDEETIYTFALALKKVNEKGEDLADATFQLPFYVKAAVDTDGAYIYAGTAAGEGLVNTLTTPASGEITIKGVQNEEYEIVETVAPDGYNKLVAPVKVTPVKTGETSTETVFYLDAAGNIVDEQSKVSSVVYSNAQIAATAVLVVNMTGVELPSTGGIGTTIFYTVGGLMMAAAVVLFVTKKKLAVQE